MREIDESVQSPDAIGRRSAIKKAVAGAAAAGLVWSAPRVEGLSLRPNYASAQSGPSSAMVDFPDTGALAPVMFDCGGTSYVLNGSLSRTGGTRHYDLAITPGDTITINAVSGGGFNAFTAGDTGATASADRQGGGNAAMLTITYDCA